MWAVLLRDVSLPARGRPIRECLSIGTCNLLAFPLSADSERERESRGVVAVRLRLSNAYPSQGGKLNKPLMAVP